MLMDCRQLRSDVHTLSRSAMRVNLSKPRAAGRVLRVIGVRTHIPTGTWRRILPCAVE
jgi:hypothetical protein